MTTISGKASVLLENDRILFRKEKRKKGTEKRIRKKQVIDDDLIMWKYRLKRLLSFYSTLTSKCRICQTNARYSYVNNLHRMSTLDEFIVSIFPIPWKWHWKFFFFSCNVNSNPRCYSSSTERKRKKKRKRE